MSPRLSKSFKSQNAPYKGAREKATMLVQLSSRRSNTVSLPDEHRAQPQSVVLSVPRNAERRTQRFETQFKTQLRKPARTQQNAAKTQFQNAKRRIVPVALQNAAEARDLLQNAAKTQTQNAGFKTQVSKRKRRTQPKRKPRDAQVIR